MRPTITCCILALCASFLNAAEPVPTIKRVLPPPGIEIPVADRAELEKLTKSLDDELAQLATKLVEPTQQALLDDVNILTKAVRFALLHNEFYDPKDVAKAKSLLKLGRERFKELQQHTSSWTKQTGLVVRGYRSQIDGAAIPYGLEIPANYDPTQPVRLVVWLHGRNDKGTDLHFIDERLKKKCEFQFEQTIILHPFGRHCNAFKFAGEVDVFEAIAQVQQKYSITGRPVLMGFSMGGAGCWHLAAHYPERWAAASPGAGFVDVRRYQGLTGDKLPPWYEQQLWDWYDVPPYTANLFRLPLLSYSGELDKQKASADIMEQEFQTRKKSLLRVIGKEMGHKYDKPSINQITKWVEQQLAREPNTPAKGLTPKSGPVSHYQSNKPAPNAVVTGPIDQAFMRAFLFVAPTGKSQHPAIDVWVKQEMEHQLQRWRELFRGEIRVVPDSAVNAELMSNYNLVLWGDPDSNAWIKKYIGQFPVRWDNKSISAGTQQFTANHHVLVGIYPTALLTGQAQATTCMVLNSGITFREGHDKTNSQQTPKLPDWAVIDISTPASETAPGKVVSAAFFDQDWKFVEPAKQQAAFAKRANLGK